MNDHCAIKLPTAPQGLLGKCLILCWPLLLATDIYAAELILGKERIPPGIDLIFEGAVKDDVTPAGQHLPIDKTHVHLEVLANWAEDGSAPAGAPGGGFIPYLKITAEVTNETSGASTLVDLVPHINLIDNLHYARNMSLPGRITDKYEVTFHVVPPGRFDLAYHKDWRMQYEKGLFKQAEFRIRHVDFEEIALATRE